MLRYLLASFSLVFLLTGSSRANTPQEDETALKEAKLDTEPAALVDFFRKRVLPENDVNKVTTLIKQLGDDSFSTREKASEQLIAMGPGVLKVLRENIKNNDYEIAYRVKEALDIVERTSTVSLLSAAARLLGHKKHPDAAKVLLDFAPVTDSDEVLDAIRTSLVNLAKKDGKPEPVLVAALTDKIALRRSLAVDALIRSNNLDNDAARKLLTDADGLVRLRAAVALIERDDKEAVPALIETLPAVKLQHAWIAEDLLCRLAGDKAPNASLSEDEASRKTARTAWEKWYKENGAAIELKKLKEAPPYLGLTVIAQQDPNTGQGKILEQDKAGKTRWEFGGINMPIADIQVLPNERILIPEMNAARVTERNKKGEIVWQKAIQQPVSAQRLVNGNTVIATRNGIFEFNAKGDQVFTYNRQRWDVWSARKHRNGEYILFTQTAVVRVNAQGKEVGSFAIGRTYSYCSFDVLPNGNIIVPLTRNNRVVEYKLDGTEVSSINVNFPTGVQRLPNGNTLVTSMNYRTITEFDKTGKQVSVQQALGNPYAAVRR